MSERYYYDCPIEAAYMQRNFGVQFDCFRVQHPDDMKRPEEPELGKNIFIGWTGSRRIYANTDSVPIFEPQVGDIVTLDRWHWERQRHPEDKFYCTPKDVACSIYNQGTYLSASYPGCQMDCNDNGKWHVPHKIIQRNGRAFIMPKKEAQTTDGGK